MKKNVVFIIACMAFSSIRAQQSISPNSSFNSFKEHFVLALWKQFPGEASGQGFHNYDSILNVPDNTERAAAITFCQAYEDSLKKINPLLLNDNNKIDYQILLSSLAARQWYINDYKAYQWNPAYYNVCGDFAKMLANNYDALDARLRNFYIKMKNVKAYYNVAKQNILNPTIEHTQLAVAQNEGGKIVFETSLAESLSKCGLTDTEKNALKSRAMEATAAINDYISFLKNLKNDNPRSFRLGEALYTKKFEYDIQSGYSAAQMYNFALEEKTLLHKKMLAVTVSLWPKYFGTSEMPADSLKAIRKMIDTLSANHTLPDSFQTEIARQIPVLAKFVTDKNLLYLDPSKPLVVRKEPAYMAGVAGASISAPGPYEKNGNTYYNVGSLAGWDAKRAESYLREYNHYLLQVLNIHEAIPGHYAQLVYANKSPSIIKAIFGNGAMIEGWAVYAERMMLENGYGNNEKELWLMYYKWNLRTVCNTILDYRVHTQNMARQTAIEFLTNEAFQQSAEAEGKWKRVSVSQVQLCSYFSGYREIYDLRTALQKKSGNSFDLKKFHEKFLSYGSAPVKYIKELMLK